MSTPKKPTEAPFVLDPKIAEAFAAHVEYHRYEVKSAAWRRARARRDKLISEIRNLGFARCLAAKLMDTLDGAQTFRSDSA